MPELTYEDLLYRPDLSTTVSDEYLMYNPFFRTEILRRLTDIAKVHDVSELKEWPVGTLLHLLDDNFMLDKPMVMVPDPEGFAMHLLPFRKFMYHVVTPPQEQLVRGMEQFILPPTGLNTTLMNYRRKYGHFLRVCLEIDQLPPADRPMVQPIINYNPLYRARILGRFRTQRRINYVLGGLINQLAKFPNRRHFIPIPVGKRQFDRQAIIRTFLKHDRTTIRFMDDPWFLFCIQLLGFIHSEKTPSLLDNIPNTMWDKIHFVLYTRSKFVVLRLDILKQLNGPNDGIMIRLIKLLNLLAEYSNSGLDAPMQDAPIQTDHKIDDSLPPPPEVDAPFVEETHLNDNTHGHDKAIAPKYGWKPRQSVLRVPESRALPARPATDRPASDSAGSDVGKGEKPTEELQDKQEVAKPETPEAKPTIVNPKDTETRINRVLSENARRVPATVPLLPVDDSWIEILPEAVTNRTNNIPIYNEPFPEAERQQADAKTTADIDAAANEVIDRHTELTPAQRRWAQNKAQAYKSIAVGDTTVGEILDHSPDEKIEDTTVECLKDVVADPSLLKSNAQQFDSDYYKKLFNRDLIANLASFNKVGMFMTGLKASDCSDPLNKATRYQVAYEDVNHKKHTINFVLPDVDERGFCYVNGTYKVMKKQRVPLPICKVSKVRVTLNSDYNKYIVSRNTQVAHSFINYIERILRKAEDSVHSILGGVDLHDKLLPYEYTTIASKYSTINIDAPDGTQIAMCFDYPNMSDKFTELKLTKEEQEAILAYQEEVHGTWFGISDNGDTKCALIMELNGTMVEINLEDGRRRRGNLIDYLCSILDVELTPLSEWTDFLLLSNTVPCIFALCYRFGLSHMLQYCKAQYRVYRKGQRFETRPSDVVVRFADAVLVIPRAPLTNSLLFGGLNWCDLKKIEIDQMDSKDVYYDLIVAKGFSVHSLKNVDNYFEYFVDPICADVLRQMREPTTAKDLLIRATQLLATEDHKPPASSCNFRYRSYERINSAIYKVMTRAHATYANKSIGATSRFSISDYEIKQLITQDQVIENVDFVNPINDIKYKSEYSHGGIGGRASADTFMVDDRQFSEDSLGIMGEAAVDNTKVAFTATMSADPTFTNLRGMTLTQPKDQLKPAQMLSATALAVPGVTQDDKLIVR